ncbi:hypothetical protein MKR66_02605 [Acinetobacter baumannii]
MSDIEAKLAKYKDKIIYSNIIETDLEFVNSTVYVGYAHGDIFLDQLKLAAHNKVPIKNCFYANIVGITGIMQIISLFFAKPKNLNVGRIRRLNVIGIDLKGY